MFVSRNYAERVWTNHERQAAQARALRESNVEYILPVRLDDTEVPGLLPSTAYVESNIGTRAICNLVLEKLGGVHGAVQSTAHAPLPRPVKQRSESQIPDVASSSRPRFQRSRAAAGILATTLFAITAGYWWTPKHSQTQSSELSVERQMSLTAGETFRVSKALWEFGSSSEGKSKMVYGDGESNGAFDRMNIMLQQDTYGDGGHKCRYGLISIESVAIRKGGQVSSCTDGSFNYEAS